MAGMVAARRRARCGADIRRRRAREGRAAAAQLRRAAAFDAARGWGGGSWPACQSRSIASSRANRRLRHAIIITITESYSQPPAIAPEGASVRIAASRALGVGDEDMG